MFVAVAQAVEELVGRQARGVSVELPVGLEFLCRTGEQQPVQRGLTDRTGLAERLGVLGGQFFLRLGRRPTRQRLAAQRLGPATGRVTQLPAQEADHRIRNVETRRVGGEFVGADARADERQRQVTDHLGRRRHLDQPAQDPVGPGVRRLDLLETVTETQRDGLLTQIRQLPAGDLVVIHPAGRCRQPGLERRVDLSQRLPVRLQITDRRQRQPRVVFRVCGRGHDGTQRRLAGGPRQRRRGTVDGVRPGLPGRQIGRQLAARGVVGVHVHRQVEPAAQCPDQRGGGLRAQQTRHVLDRQHMRAGVDDLLGEFEVVVQGVEILPRIRQVTGVRHRHFGHRGAGLTHRIDRRSHRVDVVECIEDPVDVDARRRGLLHEGVGHRFRIGRVTDGVASAQQHLQTDVGHRFAQRGQALPRVFLEEPQRDVVGRPAPALDRQQLRRHPRDVGRDHQQPRRTHPGGQQRLVRIPERRVGHPDRLGFPHPARERLGTDLGQQVFAAPRRHRVQIDLGQLVVRVDRRRPRSVRLVDGHVGQVVQDLGAAVCRGARRQQVGPFVDERRGHPPGPEVGVVDDGLQERDVRRDPADAELGQRAVGPRDRRAEVAAPAGEFDQHRVEVGTDLAAQNRAAVQADTGASRRAVGGDPAGVGTEAVRGVLGGDPALHGRPADPHPLLGQAQIRQRLPRCQP